jgi:hypothetical protein
MPQEKKPEMRSKASRTDSKLNDQEKRTQIKELIQKSRDSRMNILTKDQLRKPVESRNKKH